MNYLVKITHDEDGYKIDNPQWCYVFNLGDAPRALCSGQVFGFGEGSAKFRVKTVERGITCPECRNIIKHFKDVKL